MPKPMPRVPPVTTAILSSVALRSFGVVTEGLSIEQVEQVEVDDRLGGSTDHLGNPPRAAVVGWIQGAGDDDGVLEAVQGPTGIVLALLRV